MMGLHCHSYQDLSSYSQLTDFSCIYFLLVLFSVSPATLEPHAKLCTEQLQHTHAGIITLLGTGNKLTSTVWVGDL